MKNHFVDKHALGITGGQEPAPPAAQPCSVSGNRLGRGRELSVGQEPEGQTK
jgi:hypothetical protein